MKRKDIVSEKAEKQFMALVRAGLWGKDAEMEFFPENEVPDWKGILYLGKTQAVLPLLYDGMTGLPEGKRLSGPSLMKLIAYVDRVEKLNADLDAAAGKICAGLAAEGISSVLLKGQGNAVLYPEPRHRQCGDIDLYVGQENYLKAADVIRKWPEVHHEAKETSKHVGFGFGHLEIELHKMAFEMADRKTDAAFRIWETEELSSGRAEVLPGGEKVTVPPPMFNVIYVFCHGFHHFMESGLGLRQICDIAMLLHRYHSELDANEMEALLKEFRLLDEWRLFVSLAVRHLGLPASEAPLYIPDKQDITDKLLQAIFDDGNFGHHKDLPDFSRKPALIRKLGNLGIHHVIFFRKLKFSPRQAWLYYLQMWRNGLKGLA